MSVSDDVPCVCLSSVCSRGLHKKKDRKRKNLLSQQQRRVVKTAPAATYSPTMLRSVCQRTNLLTSLSARLGAPTRWSSTLAMSSRRTGWPAGILGSHHHHHHQMTVIRHLSKNNKNKGGGNKNNHQGSGGGGNRLKVYAMWSTDPEDMKYVEQEGDEPPEMINAGDKDAFNKVRAVIADADDYEEEVSIYNSKTKKFEPLENMEQVKREQQNAGKVFVAPGGMGDEDYNLDDDNYSPDNEIFDPYEDDDHDVADDEEVFGGFKANHMVEKVAETLKKEGWQRAAPGSLTKDGTTTPTANVILGLVEKIEDLDDFLIGRIGALDHLATCVHFDFVWDSAEI